MKLLEKITNRTAEICVIGLGYVGLPLAVAFARSGFKVVGVDVDLERICMINRGLSYIEDVPTDLLAQLTTSSRADSEFLSKEELQGSLQATSEYEVISSSDIVIICVQTPLSKTREPDLSYVISAVDHIAEHLHSDMLVAMESTAYPGTTEELILERLGNIELPLKVGQDFYLVFSPERVDPGRRDYTLSNTPKVVGGMTSRCGDIGRAFYQTLTQEVILVSSPWVAEMIKLLENTFRATNIALVNEIAIMCDRLGIDVWEVIDGASTKPFGFMPFYPGPGLGGHCLPVDPQYLAWKLRNLGYSARFIQLADEINMSMPMYWVSKAQDMLNLAKKPVNNSSILVLGATYKADTSDLRESPAIDIISALLEKGAKVSYHDPYAPELSADDFSISSITDSQLQRSLSDFDCVMIVTDHSSYDWDLVLEKAKLVVDTRDALRKR